MVQIDLHKLIAQAKKDLAGYEKDLKTLADELANFSPFKGVTELDYVEWQNRKSNLTIAQEELARSIRYKKQEIESMQSQLQIDLFKPT